MDNSKEKQPENLMKKIKSEPNHGMDTRELHQQLHLIDYKTASAKYYQQVNHLCAVAGELSQNDKQCNLLKSTIEYAQATFDLEECLSIQQELNELLNQITTLETQIQAHNNPKTQEKCATNDTNSSPQYQTLLAEKQALIDQYQAKANYLQQEIIQRKIAQCKPNYQELLKEGNYSEAKKNKAHQDIEKFSGFLKEYNEKTEQLNQEKEQCLAKLALIKQEIQDLGHQRAIEKELLVNLEYEKQAAYYADERNKLEQAIEEIQA